MVVGSGPNLITGPLDTTGIFTFEHLAEGEYTIRFLTMYPSYPVVDSTFRVISGKTTDAGTIIMKGTE